jgi:transcription antitermination factor NusG
VTEPIWYAVHCGPRCEKKASTELSRKGYFTFYPFLRQKRYVGRRRFPREVDMPLFSRYIFVAFRSKPREAIGDVNDTNGVSTVVYLGGEPLSIPSKVVDALMAITDECDDDGEISYIVNAKRLAEFTDQKEEHWFKGKPGDQVQMLDEAPYYGLIAELASIEHLDKKEEISVWLNVLGARRKVEVRARAVASIISGSGSKPVPRSADVTGRGRLKRA